MKQIIFTLTLLLLAACQHENVLPEATTAAKEVYLQYADRKDLTVALIGDYQRYNAVMLQAQTTEDWLRLCEKFGVKMNINAQALDSIKVSSLGVTKLINVDSGVVAAYGDPRVAASRIIDSLVGVVIPPEIITPDTVYSIRHNEHYDHGLLVDSSTTITSDASSIGQLFSPSINEHVLRTSHKHGNTGYIIHDDSETLTLWLFFYCTPAEKEQILNHITSKNTQK